MRCEDLSICTITPADAARAKQSTATAARSMRARRRMGHFCPLAAQSAAILRFLGKDQSTGVNGWKFAEKSEYLGPIHAGRAQETDDTTQYAPPSPCADDAASRQRARQG